MNTHELAGCAFLQVDPDLTWPIGTEFRFDWHQRRVIDRDEANRLLTEDTSEKTRIVCIVAGSGGGHPWFLDAAYVRRTDRYSNGRTPIEETNTWCEMLNAKGTAWAYTIVLSFEPKADSLPVPTQPAVHVATTDTPERDIRPE